MNAWKDERDLRIKYESRSSLKAFNIIVKEFNSFGKIKIKDVKFNILKLITSQ